MSEVSHVVFGTRGVAFVLAVVLGIVALACRAAEREGFRILASIAAVLAVVFAAHGFGFDRSDVQTLLTNGPWLLGTLLILFVFRRQVRQAVETLAQRFGSSAVDLDIAAVIKIKIPEPVAGEATPVALPFSRSPFEIDSESVLDQAHIRFDLRPQLQLPVTDYVAKRWVQEL